MFYATCILCIIMYATLLIRISVYFNKIVNGHIIIIWYNVVHSIVCMQKRSSTHTRINVCKFIKAPKKYYHVFSISMCN